MGKTPYGEVFISLNLTPKNKTHTQVINFILNLCNGTCRCVKKC